MPNNALSGGTVGAGKVFSSKENVAGFLASVSKIIAHIHVGLNSVLQVSGLGLPMAGG